MSSVKYLKQSSVISLGNNTQSLTIINNSGTNLLVTYYDKQPTTYSLEPNTQQTYNVGLVSVSLPNSSNALVKAIITSTTTNQRVTFISVDLPTLKYTRTGFGEIDNLLTNKAVTWQNIDNNAVVTGQLTPQPRKDFQLAQPIDYSNTTTSIDANFLYLIYDNQGNPLPLTGQKGQSFTSSDNGYTTDYPNQQSYNNMGLVYLFSPRNTAPKDTKMFLLNSFINSNISSLQSTPTSGTSYQNLSYTGFNTLSKSNQLYNVTETSEALYFNINGVYTTSPNYLSIATTIMITQDNQVDVAFLKGLILNISIANQSLTIKGLNGTSITAQYPFKLNTRYRIVVYSPFYDNLLALFIDGQKVNFMTTPTNLPYENWTTLGIDLKHDYQQLTSALTFKYFTDTNPTTFIPASSSLNASVCMGLRQGCIVNNGLNGKIIKQAQPTKLFQFVTTNFTITNNELSLQVNNNSYDLIYYTYDLSVEPQIQTQGASQTITKLKDLTLNGVVMFQCKSAITLANKETKKVVVENPLTSNAIALNFNPQA